MNRRAVIAMPAALAALPAAELGSPAPTPVQRRFQRWEAAKRAENAVHASSNDDARHEAAWQARWAVEERLMQTPSATPEDVLRKAAAWSNYGRGNLEGTGNPHLTQFWAELTDMIGCDGADAPALGAPADPALPLLALWRQAQALTDQLNAADRADDPDAWDARAAQLVLLENEIAASPAETPLAWAVKIANADGGLIGETSSLGRALVDQARNLLEKIA